MARLRRHRHRKRLGAFIAEGVREVSRAYEAGLKLLEIYWCPSMIEGTPAEHLVNRWIGDDLIKQPCTLTQSLISKLSYRDCSEGLLAVFEQPCWNLDDMFNGTRVVPKGVPDLWLVAVGTQKPGNLGAMARSAYAAGGHGLIICEGLVDPFNPNAIRASTGAVFRLPMIDSSASELIRYFRRRKVRVFAAQPQSVLAYYNVNFTGPVALVIGPEDTGLTGVWESSGNDMVDPKLSIETIGIPMANELVDSLNASVAASILLFEVARQRNLGA